MQDRCKIKVTTLLIGVVLFFTAALHAPLARSEAKQDQIGTCKLIAPCPADEKLDNVLTTLSERLSSVEGAIAKASERAYEDRIRTSWFAFATVVASTVLGALGGWLIQKTVFVNQQRINREQAEAEVSNAYVEWQLKQLSELYGPLRALLGQSRAMYLQMNRVLAAAAEDKFRIRQARGQDSDDNVFEIFQNNKWVRFRTVQHLGDVYGKGYGVEPYFDDVVAVGARVAELIRVKAGYVSQSDTELIKEMGTYLAHYAVLSRLHTLAKEQNLLETNIADQQASFPSEMQKLVGVGFERINSEVLNWANPRRNV